MNGIGAGGRPTRDVPVDAVLCGVAAAQVAVLASILFEPGPSGAPPVDFVLVWAAGTAARAGEATAFYDPAIAKAYEVAAAGRDFAGVYRWVYPPILLLLALPLSAVPIGAAHAVFAASSFAAFAALLARIGGRTGLLVASAWPASLACAIVGQNGFLTAMLLGAGTLALDRRPYLAGGLYGLLAFKPHLAVLVPIALLAARRWSPVPAAIGTALALAAASVAWLGIEPWRAFVAAVPATGDGLLGHGIMGFGKLQSAWGAARWVGATSMQAATVQAASALSGAVLIWCVWRDARASSALRLAALACGTALATPYVYVYDLPILALAVAALLRGGVDGVERAGLTAAGLCLLAYPFTGCPTGLFATSLVAGLVARRAFPRRIPAAWWRTDPGR